MAHSIKYNSSSSETLCEKKGNWWITSSDVIKGPTSSTGFWSGITPPAGGYTIYENKAANGPSIRTAASDSELITVTAQISGTVYATAADCLNYYNGQTDKIVINRESDAIVRSNLILHYDAGQVASYPKNGTSISDMSTSSYTGTLTNGPTYSSADGGSISFDGVDDHVTCGTTIVSSVTGSMTAEAWFKLTATSSDWVRVIGTGGNGGNNRTFGLWYNTNSNYILWQRYGSVDPNILITQALSLNTWYHFVGTTNGNSHALYLNNVQKGTATAAGPWPSSTENLTLGYAGFHAPIKGNISIARVYDRALTSTEVSQNWLAQKARFGY